MLLVFHDSAKIGERVTTRYTILHCAILHFTLYPMYMILNCSATSRDHRPVIFEGLFCIQILTFSRPLFTGKHMKEKKEKKQKEDKHKHKSRHEL